MAGTLENIISAFNRFEGHEETPRDVSLLEKYGIVDTTNRTVRFNLDKIVKKAGIPEKMIETRLYPGKSRISGRQSSSEHSFNQLSNSRSRKPIYQKPSARGVSPRLYGRG